jgi:hypothetical protein
MAATLTSADVLQQKDDVFSDAMCGVQVYACTATGSIGVDGCRP